MNRQVLISLSIFSINFSGAFMAISRNFVFVKRWISSGGSGGANGVGGILGAGTKKNYLGVICFGGKEAWKTKLFCLGGDGCGNGGV